MSKIVMEQEDLEEILDNYDYKKSLFISELRKLNEGNSTFAHKPKLFFSVNPEHVNNLF